VLLPDVIAGEIVPALSEDPADEPLLPDVIGDAVERGPADPPASDDDVPGPSPADDGEAADPSSPVPAPPSDPGDSDPSPPVVAPPADDDPPAVDNGDAAPPPADDDGADLLPPAPSPADDSGAPAAVAPPGRSPRPHPVPVSRPVIPPLPPALALAASPYHEPPFASAEFIEARRASRWGPQYSPRLRRLAPLKLASPRKAYGPDPAADYVERDRLMRSMDLQFRDALHEKYREEFADTPYHELLLRTRAMGLELSADRAQERDQKWVRQRIRENSEVRAAKKESYKHDLYHLDEIYPFGHRSLRVIPVTNRYQSEVPLSKLPLI
jgi:hypothetical protein